MFIHNISSKHDRETTALLLRKRRRRGRVPPGLCVKTRVGAQPLDMEIIFHSHGNKTHFHKKGCAPSLILKVRVFGTRKWPISYNFLVRLLSGSVFMDTSRYEAKAGCFQIVMFNDVH